MHSGRGGGGGANDNRVGPEPRPEADGQEEEQEQEQKEEEEDGQQQGDQGQEAHRSQQLMKPATTAEDEKARLGFAANQEEEGPNSNGNSNDNSNSNRSRSSSSGGRRLRETGLRLQIPIAMEEGDAAAVLTMSHTPSPFAVTSSSIGGGRPPDFNATRTSITSRRRSSWDVEKRPDSALVRRLKLERSNDGGGVSIRGFFVSTGCYVVMFVMAVLFLVFGVTLLAVSYRKVDEEEMEQKAQSSESVESNTNYARVVGPIFMTLGLLLFAAALCLCLLAMKASQADRLRSYSAKSNSRISAVGSAGAAGGWGSPEQKSAEIFAPAISAVMPLSLLATPAVIMAEGKTSDLGRLLNLIPLGQNKEDFLPEHDPMHAVAPVHGRPRRNSLPASVSGGLGGSGGFGGGGGRRVTTPDEAERHRIYQRGSTRRASLFSEARQELSHTFRPRSSPPVLPEQHQQQQQQRQQQQQQQQQQQRRHQYVLRRPVTPPRDSGVIRRDVACFPSEGPGMLEVCQETALPHIVVSDNPAAASGRHPQQHQDRNRSAERRVKFRLEAVEVVADDDGGNGNGNGNGGRGGGGGGGDGRRKLSM